MSFSASISEVCAPMFLELSRLLSEIPNVVWSGVIASLLTLSGVLASNWFNTRHLKLKLDHDSHEKEKERKAQLRNEVYLLAAQEMTRVNSYLASLPQLDFAKESPGEGLTDFLVIAAKVQLISEQRTSLLVGDLVATYSELAIRSIMKCQPIQAVKTAIVIRESTIDRCQSEITRILAAMTQHNESAHHDEAVFDALQSSFSFQQEQVSVATKELEELWQRRNELYADFTRDLFAELKCVAEMQVSVMVDLRRELELDGDGAEFAKLMKRTQNRMQSQLDVALDHLKPEASSTV